MARRLATEYVKARMQMTEPQLTLFLSSLPGQTLVWRVKVMDNGNQEVVLEDGQGDAITFLFEKQGNRYVCVTSCRLLRPKLTQIMHKLVMEFRGEAVVNRIFAGFTMQYVYAEGKVCQIVEQQGEQARIVYEQKDFARDLQMMYGQDIVEQQIAVIREQINELLDARNRELNDQVTFIDQQLHELSHQLFVLEA
ncbi:non-ribosomal peptide synthetase module [Paenibacillus agilis]|uniref:Non-ribosomal peptide synthetase module n=1 Tax=Paenibacillus agilis TaxID=3020863 RepID=A0A559IHZ2_9BACL|nr:non-ribosomal peptide synthetase module [Paenibacillus agilis]TVX87231.1 non-ribosomal peptide synthetase module [Paenibacillus agilis]